MDRNETYQVLILDDDILLGELLKTFLQTSGPFQVEQIIMGSDLRDRLDAKHYDLLMLDYHLPDTTGLDILNALAILPVHPPVIMMTGKGDQRTAAQAIQLGASDYLVKGQDFWPGLAALAEKTIRIHELQESARKSMEQVQYQSLLLDNMRDAVVVWNLEGKITFWNPAAYLLFNIKPKDIIGCPVQSAYLDLFKPHVFPPKPGDTATSESEREFSTYDGRSLWISARLMPLRRPENPNLLLGYMDVSRDITHRKRDQQSLLESQKFVQKVVNTTPNIIYIYDLTQNAITFINQVVMDVLGYNPENVLALAFDSVRDYLHPQDQERVAEQIKTGQNSRDGIVNEFEYRLRHKKGYWCWLYSRESVFSRDIQGRPNQIIGVAQDITERKRNDAKIQKAQTQLMQAARLSSIGQLATGVAHQISNPLTSVLGEAQLLLHKLPKDHPLRESIQTIETAGWRAQWAVEILTKFSEPPSDTITVFNLYKTIDLAVNLIGVNLKSEGVTLEVDLGGEPPQVRGNEQQFESLWVNLLLFIRSIITDVISRKLRIHSVDLGNSLTGIAVEINDVYVTEEQLNIVFDPNLAAISTDVISGMEFSICQEIIRQNRGTIQVSSDQNLTIFHVKLPREL